jgi:HAD superfamily phosphoserine phosphatase-like hydrolase
MSVSANPSFASGRGFTVCGKTDFFRRSGLQFTLSFEGPPRKSVFNNGALAPEESPPFYPHAVELVARHAKSGHQIVLVTGTLEPLAREAARALQVVLLRGGSPVQIAVCATRLEEIDGRWTGRIVGEPMFGPAKARAVRQIATERGLDLARCYAYGNSTLDLEMLEAVGHPAAVNPNYKLKHIARKRRWPTLDWKSSEEPQHPSLRFLRAFCDAALSFVLSSASAKKSPERLG